MDVAALVTPTDELLGEAKVYQRGDGGHACAFHSVPRPPHVQHAYGDSPVVITHGSLPEPQQVGQGTSRAAL